jgi:formylglycine-generating enzyme required for sulfatase activity
MKNELPAQSKGNSDQHHSTSGGCYKLSDSESKLDPSMSWRNPGFDHTNSHPVTFVNWNDAKAYAQWLRDKTGKGYRILFESE